MAGEAGTGDYGRNSHALSQSAKPGLWAQVRTSHGKAEQLTRGHFATGPRGGSWRLGVKKAYDRSSQGTQPIYLKLSSALIPRGFSIITFTAACWHSAWPVGLSIIWRTDLFKTKMHRSPPSELDIQQLWVGPDNVHS